MAKSTNDNWFRVPNLENCLKIIELEQVHNQILLTHHNLPYRSNEQIRAAP